MLKTYSDEQRAVIKEILTSFLNIAINATAGSGKTFVLVEMAKMLPSNTSAVFLAFNKSIVEELAEKLPSGFDVSTLHSLGIKVLYRTYGSGVKLLESKYRKILYRITEPVKNEVSKKEYNSLIYSFLEKWDHYRVTLDSSLLEADPADFEGGLWLKFIKEIDKVNSRPPKRGVPFEIDFTDMIYLPVKNKLRTPQWTNVLLDESQDLNNCQHAFIEMILGKESRLISVGDEEQCIYSFAGSNPLSFAKFAQRPNTIQYTLSTTYRCAKKIVGHALQYSRKIQALPDAPEGEVRIGTLDEVRAKDFILCRNNAPLIDAYFNLLSEDKKAYIIGKDTREAYLQMVKPFEKSHIGAVLEHWCQMREDLYDRLYSKGIRKPEKVDSYRLLEEKIAGLEIIASKCKSVKDMMAKIEAIFEPTKDSIVLSTIHKSKGLQAGRVFLLRWDLMFSKEMSDTDMQQERNLAFVAITRAEREIVYIIEPIEADEPEED
jgi:DNA helicase-2/ATP-dependent DNA helicase PcrA